MSTSCTASKPQGRCALAECRTASGLITGMFSIACVYLCVCMRVMQSAALDMQCMHVGRSAAEAGGSRGV